MPEATLPTELPPYKRYQGLDAAESVLDKLRLFNDQPAIVLIGTVGIAFLAWLLGDAPNPGVAYASIGGVAAIAIIASIACALDAKKENEHRKGEAPVASPRVRQGQDRRAR